MKKSLKKILSRFTSPVVWAGLIALIGVIFNAAGVELSELKTWGIFFQEVGNILGNPFIILSVIVAVFSFINNPSSKKDF